MLASTSPLVLFIRVECRRHWCYHMNPLTFGFARTVLRLFSPQDRDLECHWNNRRTCFKNLRNRATSITSRRLCLRY